jgi:hypothetical protein
MITKFNKYLITENPDTIKTNGEEYKYNDNDAIPLFSIISDNNELENMYIGRKGIMHSDIDGINDVSSRKSYPGRLWLNSKLMSFWTYPDEKLFKSMILFLEKNLNIKIFKNGWQLEVVEIDGEIAKRKEGENIYYSSYGDYETTIISLDYYTGSNDVPEEIKLQHLMNWKDKELAKKSGDIKTGNFGSNLTSWDKPHNIKYRQKIYQEKYNNK